MNTTILQEALSARLALRDAQKRENKVKSKAVAQLKKQGSSLVELDGQLYVARMVGKSIHFETVHGASERLRETTERSRKVREDLVSPEPDPPAAPEKGGFVAATFFCKSELCQKITSFSSYDGLNDWANSVLPDAYKAAQGGELPEDPGGGKERINLRLESEVLALVDEYAEEHCPNPRSRGQGSRSAALRRMLAWSVRGTS